MPVGRTASRGQLLLVTGKGGVGKTTVASALAWRLAAEGRRVLLLELDPRESAHQLLGLPPSGGERVTAAPRLELENVRPRRAIDTLVERHVRPRPLVRVLRESAVYDQFVEGCPGLREAAVLSHALDALGLAEPAPRSDDRFDVVVLDAPATGHALSLLEAPSLLASVVERGPFGALARRVAEVVTDVEHCRVVAVARAEELPVTETLELRSALATRLGRRVDALVVDALWPDEATDEAAPSIDGRIDPALALLERRIALQRAQLERLRRAWAEPIVELPLLPIDPGPDLLRALARRLDDLVETLAGPVPAEPRARPLATVDGAAARNDPRAPVGDTVATAKATPANGAPRPAWIERLPPLTVVVGSGGVGKTTLAAAVALASAESGRPTLAMTFDPAHRLRDALGLDPVRPSPVPQRVAGAHGELHALLLDARSTFDALVEHYAPGEAARRRVLENPFYRQLGGNLAGILEYMAVEKLFEESARGDYQRIVLDTPPIRHALEFLDAPGRIVRFLDSGVRRLAARQWFDSQGRLRAGGPFRGRIERAIDELVGVDFVRAVLEFFAAFEPLFDGFRRRAAQVERLLRSESTTFVLVSGPGEQSVPDVLFFARQLVERGHSLDRVLVNRVHPAPADAGAPPGSRGTELLRWLARRDARGIARLRELLGERPLDAVPLLGREPGDLEGLREIARRLV